MGRPLNKKYFGNTNTDGVGGESVASVTVVSGDSASYDAADAITFSAPQISGGTTATGTIVVGGSGEVTGVTVTNGGTGYTSAPTVTITTSTGTQTTLTLTAVLTATAQNGIVCQGITSGSTNRTSGNDIIKQVSATRFKIRTQDGTAVCKLKASAPTAAGEMAIVATDASSGTYYVTKISGHKVQLTRGTGTVYVTGQSVPWTFGTATATLAKLPNA